MKNLLFILFVIGLCFSCKEKEDNKIIEKELNIAQKIANANGFANWQDVSQIDFTFNVDRDSTHFERSWSWRPKTGDITLISANDTISYNQKTVDSISLNADKSFINDKYWLMAPYQLVWDQSAKLSEPSKEKAPISAIEMNKVTITYSQDGGYTPGDAYDFYYGDDFIVKEWVFRQGNSNDPSMITTWEDYEDFNGIMLSKTHKKPEGDWKLHFTNIKVVK